MAARGSQGYLIAVIILTLMVMVFGILSYLGFSRASETADQLTQAQDNIRVEKEKSTARDSLVKILLSQSGVDSSNDAVLDTLKSQVNKDAEMKLAMENSDTAFNRYMSQAVSNDDGFAGANSYQQVIDELLAVIGKNHGTNVSLVNQVRQEKSAAEVEIQQIKEKLAVATQKIADLTTNLKGESDRNKEKEDELQSLIVAHEGRITELTTAATNKQKDLDAAIKESVEKVALMEKELREVKRENEMLTSLGDSILPDARVADVTGNIVSLNIGSLDGLRKLQSFSVYDLRETDFENAQPKAKIEVLKITGPHTAEALIRDRMAGNPILSNDHVISPTWDPGFQVPIAFVGSIDLDGDGKPDTERFKAMLEQNGAKIAAWHDDAGKRMGEISATTRYLIEGEAPTDPKVGDSFNYYKKQAEQFSVQRISARRFLERLLVPMRSSEMLDRNIGDNKPLTQQQQQFKTRSAFDKGR